MSIIYICHEMNCYAKAPGNILLPGYIKKGGLNVEEETTKPQTLMQEIGF